MNELLPYAVPLLAWVLWAFDCLIHIGNPDASFPLSRFYLLRTMCPFLVSGCIVPIN